MPSYYLYVDRDFECGYSTKETEKGVEFSFDAPGYSKEEVKVTQEGKYILVEANNQKRGKLKRYFVLHDWFNPESISAGLKNGELTIRVDYQPSYKKTITVHD